MRHGKKDNHLGRTAAHRAALLSNMASSLIMHKRISTTLAKAKALRMYVEPLLSKSKVDSTHSRRTVMAYLMNKESVKELFDDVAGRIANRPGGYTRIIKIGEKRLGDNSSMCLIELVDYNETTLEAAAEQQEAATKTRRSRRSGGAKKADGAEAATEAAPVAVAATEAPAVAATTTEEPAA